MSLLDNVKLKDCEDKEVRKVKFPRKIGFRIATFQKISKFWKRLRLNWNLASLNRAEKKFVNTTLTEEEYTSKEGKDIIAKRAKKIAKLEEKINFLQTGEKSPKKSVKSRAIKLKKNMIKYMRYNCDGVYSLPSDKIVLVFGTEKTKNDEKGSESADLSREDIKEAIKDVFKQKGSNEGSEIDKDTIKSAVEEAVSKMDGTTPKEESKVSKNGSSAAKINKFIKEDGTYRLGKNDIDPEFRITPIELPSVKSDFPHTVMPTITDEPLITPSIDKEKNGLNDDIFEKNTKDEESNNKAEGEVIREMPIVVSEKDKFNFVNDHKQEMTDDQKVEQQMSQLDQMFKEVKPLVESVSVEPKKEIDTETPLETENKPDDKGQQNIHFDYTEASVKDLTEAVEKAESKEDIQALLTRVAELKEARDNANKRAAEAKAAEEETKDRYNATRDRLTAFTDALAEDTKRQEDAANAANERRATQEKIIADMLEAIGPTAINVSLREEGNGKGK